MQHATDALGRLVKVMELGTSADPRSLETDYAYDTLSSLTSVNQHGTTGETARTRSFTYDSLARLITSSNPETGTICYGTWSSGSCLGGYDANGNLLYKTDANGVTMSYSYDPLNRLLAKSASDSSVNDSYVYDWGIGPNEVGHLSWVEHFGIAATAFFYDAMGHVASTGLYAPGMSWQSGNGLVYGLSGSPYYISYPSGQGITESHDAAGRLTSVTSSNTGLPFFSSAVYTAAGALASATYGNGVTEAIAYNSRLQPCHTQANSPAVAPMTGYGNVYDRVSSYANSPTSSSPCNVEPGNNGNIAYISDNLTAGWTQSFSYDGLNRLLTASRSDAGYSHNYNYDSFGNLLVHDNISPSLTANFSISSGTNQLDRINPITSTSLYAYDAAGNLTSSDTSMGTGTSSIGGHNYAYNALSQINSVDGGATAAYLYDGQDERVNKTTGSTWTDYIYYGGQPMSELASDGTASNYIYANGQKIVKMTIPSGGTPTLNYYLDDHLGTTQVELDASGNVTWQGQFTPFGSELPDGSTAMHYKFTGKERDAESGLDFFGARYYASPTGRWMSPDWAESPDAVPYANLQNPQSLNLYSYVNNSPLSGVDKDGHTRHTYTDCDPDTWNSKTNTLTAGKCHTYSLSDGAVTPGDNGLGLAVGGMVGKIFLKPVAGVLLEWAADIFGESAIDITEDGLEHVMEGHSTQAAKAAGKSIFNGSRGEIKNLIKKAASTTAKKQANGNLERVVNAGKTIGIDRTTGAPTSTYTVITKTNGELVTAFPGRP